MFRDPHVGSQIVIDGQAYCFTEATNAPGIIYAEIGRKAKVYRVINDNQAFALKAFKPRYRSPEIVDNSQRIAKFQNIPGLSVAKRLVITPETHSELIKEHEAFAFGILMPWIDGKSWFNYVTGRVLLKREESLRLARALTNAICELEQRDLAHCDLSSSNFIFSADFAHVDLIDIEEMFGYGLLEPETKPTGTGGYAPAWMKENGIWEAGADRFQLGILISEILGWQFEDIRQASDSDAFFAEDEFGTKTKRFRILSERLEQIHPELSRLFKAVWYAESIEECPRAGDWKRVLDGIRDPDMVVTPGFLQFGLLDLRTKPIVQPQVTMEINNTGGGILEGQVVPNVSWLTVTPTEFTCHEGKISKHTVILGLGAPVTKDRADYSFKDAITIQCNQRTQTLSGTYSVAQHQQKRPKWLIPTIAALVLVGLFGFALLGRGVLLGQILGTYKPTVLAGMPTLSSPTEVPSQPTAKSISTAIPATSILISEFNHDIIWEQRSILRNGEFLSPMMVAIDRQSHVYITDGTCQVQVFTLTGEFIRRWGHCGTGDGEFSRPEGIAIDANGLIYVVDKYKGNFWEGHGRVEVFNSDGSYIKSLGDFDAPSGIAIGPDGIIYIVVQNESRIQMLSTIGDSLGSWGASGTEPGEFDFRNGFPSGIASDSDGYVYITDMANNRVQKFTSTGQFVNQWGTMGSEPGQMSWPMGIAVNSSGKVFVVDGENHRVQVFDTNGNYLNGFGKPGISSGQFGGSWIGPIGIAVTPNDQIVVVDSENNRIETFNTDNSFIRSWGKLAYSNKGELLFPNGVAIAKQGDIYVADNGHQSIVHFSSNGQFIEAWVLSDLSYMGGLEIDSTGDFYTLDLNNDQIAKISSRGQLLKLWGGRAWTENHASTPNGMFECPEDIALFRDRVYASDSCANQVQVFDLDGNFIEKWKIQSPDGKITSPSGISSDSQGNLYIIDTTNSRIEKVSPQGYLLREWSYSSWVTDQTQSPSLIAVNPSGFIYLGYPYSKQILILDSQGNLIGKWQFNTNESLPTSITFDLEGYVYATGAHYLSKFHAPEESLTASWLILTSMPASTPMQILRIILSQNAYIRSGPGFVYPVVTGFVKNKELVAIGRNTEGNWLCVQLENGKTGWILASLVQMDFLVMSLPELQVPPTPIPVTLQPTEESIPEPPDPTSTLDPYPPNEATATPVPYPYP